MGGVLCCIAIGFPANINAQGETNSDATESVGLYPEGMPSKHKACTKLYGQALPYGRWASRHCLGWVNCSGNGLVLARGNCQGGKVFNGTACVHRRHEGELNCAQCKEAGKPVCRVATYSR